MTTAGWLRRIGYFLGLCAAVAMVKAGIDLERESARAKWPRTVATILESTYRQAYAGRLNQSGTRFVWYIQTELRYTVNGEEVTASYRSRVTADADVRARMRRWIAQHPREATLAIRYDPRRPGAVTPDDPEMPESGPQAPDDRRMVLVLLVPAAVLMAASRLLRMRKASGRDSDPALQR